MKIRLHPEMTAIQAAYIVRMMGCCLRYRNGNFYLVPRRNYVLIHS